MTNDRLRVVLSLGVFGASLASMLVFRHFAIHTLDAPVQHQQTTLALLVEDGCQGKTLVESRVMGALVETESSPLTRLDEERAFDYVNRHPDIRSYHLLFFLRTHHNASYKRIPVGTRASILCSALENLPFLNDWGDLTLNEDM